MAMKKQIWAGVVSGQIRFFGQDPEGSVQGLQGLRKFHVTDQCKLVDDSGTNILDNTAGTGGTEGNESLQQPGGGAGQQTA